MIDLKDMSVLNTKKCLRTKYDQTPKYDTSLDSAHRAEQFDIALDHFQPEPDYFWPAPNGSGRHRHVVQLSPNSSPLINPKLMRKEQVFKGLRTNFNLQI